jgi:hypothetical protein
MIWGEPRVAHAREQIVDVAKLVRFVSRSNHVWQLFQFLIGFASAVGTLVDFMPDPLGDGIAG